MWHTVRALYPIGDAHNVWRPVKFNDQRTTTTTSNRVHSLIISFFVSSWGQYGSEEKKWQRQADGVINRIECTNYADRSF